MLSSDLSVQQVAEQLGVSCDLVRARIKSGVLRAYSIGAPNCQRPTYRIPPAEVIAFRIRQRPSGGPGNARILAL